MSKPPRKRTPFARWLWEHGFTPKDGVAPLGRSFEAVRQYALDFDDPKRTIPSPEVMARIVAWTRGEITPADFYPPELSDKPADEDWHSREFLTVEDAP